MRIALTAGLLLLLSAPPAFSGSDWIDIKGAAELRALYSDKTFRGNDWIGYYRADGTVDVLILSNGQSFRSYHAASGDMIVQRADAMEFAGRWKVREDGAHCVYFDREGCGKLSQNADGTYTRTVDGVPTFRWVKITPGKDF